MKVLRRMQNTCHPSFQDGLTNILAQTSCHKQIRAFVCDVRGCNFETARQLQRRKLMLTTILRRCINYGSACLRATSRRLRSRITHCHTKRKRGNQAERKCGCRLDSYVATMLLLGLTYGRFKYSATQTKFGYHRAKMHDIITK